MSGFVKDNGSPSSSSKEMFGTRGRGVDAGISCDICPRRGCGDDTGLGVASIFGGELYPRGDLTIIGGCGRRGGGD